MIRSPLFYVGDKYKLMPQLLELFPKEIECYIEPFVGGGSSFLYVNSCSYILNDINPWIIALHKELNKYSKNEKKLLTKLYSIIDEYNLSCSYRNINVPRQLKEKYPKTYYAHYNKESYKKLKDDFNKDKKDLLKLYILLIYGFNHMIRFNNNGDFNLPVGDVDFNKNVYNALHDYLSICKERKIQFSNVDYSEILKQLKKKNKTFVYCDPPYLISASEYNKLWTETDEQKLYDYLDILDNKGIKFGLTNLLTHKGNTNKLLKKWSKKYKVYKIQSNYISFNDNSIKDDSLEIYVTNI